MKYIEWNLNWFNFNSTIGLRFNWKKMICKSVEKVLKIYSWIWCWKQKLNKFKKAPFYVYLLGNGLNIFQFEKFLLCFSWHPATQTLINSLITFLNMSCFYPKHHLKINHYKWDQGHYHILLNKQKFHKSIKTKRWQLSSTLSHQYTYMP